MPVLPRVESRREFRTLENLEMHAFNTSGILFLGLIA